MPEQTTRQIVPQGNKGSLPAQRTYGTTDPGGVWHPVHCRECLTILLGTYAENGQCNRPTTTCIVFGTACLCLCLGFPVYLPIGICRSKSHQRTPCTDLVHRSMKRVRTKVFFFVQVHLCPVAVL